MTEDFIRCVLFTESEQLLLDRLLANYQVEILQNLIEDVSCDIHNPLDKLMEAAEKLKPSQTLRNRIKPRG
jgi:hypothetical protein